MQNAQRHRHTLSPSLPRPFLLPGPRGSPGAQGRLQAAPAVCHIIVSTEELEPVKRVPLSLQVPMSYWETASANSIDTRYRGLDKARKSPT